MIARLEIACFSPDSALVALKAGAHRIELCGGPVSSGGLTPSRHDLKRVKEAAGGVPIHVMIRPRAGNFTYTKDEITAMEASMAELDALADGFVFGALDDENEVDVSYCVGLSVAAGRTKPCIFHRAIDETKNYVQALNVIRDLDFTGVLTSGTKQTAAEGVADIIDAVAAVGDKVEIVVGGGVRSNNLPQLVLQTGAAWYHSSALVNGIELADTDEIIKMLKILEGGDDF